MYGIRPRAIARSAKYPSTAAPSSRPCDREHNIETCRHCHFRTIPCRLVVSSCTPLFPLSTYTSTRPGAVLRINTIDDLLAFPHDIRVSQLPRSRNCRGTTRAALEACAHWNALMTRRISGTVLQDRTRATRTRNCVARSGVVLSH